MNVFVGSAYKYDTSTSYSIQYLQQLQYVPVCVFCVFILKALQCSCCRCVCMMVYIPPHCFCVR